MTLTAKAIAAALVAALLFWAGWTTQGWRAEAKLYDLKREHAESLAIANAEALERYKKMEEQKDAAIKSAEERAAKNAAAANLAQSTADGLRGDIAAMRANIATITDSAVREYADSLSDVLGACADEAVELARAADGHAADVRLMQDAWPK